MSLNFFAENEEKDKEESIDNYKFLFSEYENNSPTLPEALYQMFQSESLSEGEISSLTNYILQICKKKIDPRYTIIKSKYSNISRTDAYIICSYSCELPERKYNPYSILNRNLVSDNRFNGIRNVSKYAYLLLKSLRKLPKYYPKNPNILYRCIRRHVNIEEDENDENIVPYKIGNKKTFWAFTSTSPDQNLSFDFLKDNGKYKVINAQGEDEERKLKSGTIFTLEGDIWGYNITLFNYYNEKEILMEPERKFTVTNCIGPVNDIIFVTCKILNNKTILDNIKSEKTIKQNESTDKKRKPFRNFSGLKIRYEIPNENRFDYEERRNEDRKNKERRKRPEIDIRFNKRSDRKEKKFDIKESNEDNSIIINDIRFWEKRENNKIRGRRLSSLNRNDTKPNLMMTKGKMRLIKLIQNKEKRRNDNYVFRGANIIRFEPRNNYNGRNIQQENDYVGKDSYNDNEDLLLQKVLEQSLIEQ